MRLPKNEADWIHNLYFDLGKFFEFGMQPITQSYSWAIITSRVSENLASKNDT